MPKISTSLAIAFAIHILLLIIYGITLRIDNKPQPRLINTQNSINVILGSSKISQPSSHAQSNVVSGNLPSSKKITHSALESMNSSNDLSGNGNGNGNGNGEATYDFENLAVSYKEPVYPKLAIKRGLQGSIKIRVTVSINGKPTHTEILKSSGHDLLDQAALEAVSYWQFQSKDSTYFVEKTIIFQFNN